jgi:hypothetical protein
MKHIQSYETFINENVLNEEWQLKDNKLMVLNPSSPSERWANQEPTRYEYDDRKGGFVAINYGSQGEESAIIPGCKVDKTRAEEVLKTALKDVASQKFKTWQEADAKIKAAFKAACK